MSALLHDTRTFEGAANALVKVGQHAFHHGWVPATSGNFSCRLNEDTVAITVSGRHKGFLTLDDVMLVDYDGNSLDGKRPSAETRLHVELYRRDPAVGAVLHTHSVASTVLSRVTRGELVLEGLEVLKAFAGIDTHETTMTLPVFANDQDVVRLAAAVNDYLDGNAAVPGYLIAGHGLYAWGGDVAETMRHLEAFEFLFQCELEMRRIAVK